MGAGLYIHIPFCHSKCSYCDFYSMPLRQELENAYMDALLAEWRMRRDEIRQPITTIYLGGGTPSILSDANLSRLVSGLDLDIDSLSEFTIEVNPEDITPQRASLLGSLGINRVSMGVQSLDDKLLQTIGRRHESHTAIRAYETLRSCGFGNISLDLMYGLPTQTLMQWEQTLHMMLDKLHPEHLSAYILSYEPGTRMTAMRDAGKLKPIDDETTIGMYHLLCQMSRDYGYGHYEISNFALPGREARHNAAYWDMSPYIGLGPGAHSFDGISTRRSNPWNLRKYISSLSSGFTVCEEEKEDAVTLHNDIVMVSLRTRRGLDLVKWHEHADRWLDAARPYLASGEMILTDDRRLVISEYAWPMADTYISELLMVD